MRSSFIHKLIDRIERVDSSELQQLFVRLAQEAGLLETIFDALQEGVIVTSPEGLIDYVNPAACGMFGIKADSVRGHKISQRLAGVDWHALTSSDKVVSRDLEVYYPENRFLNFYVLPLRPRGDSSHSSEDTTPGHDEEIAGYAMVIRDVTEERKSAERMIESEQLSALTMLAAGVAHEIGNPLNSLHIHLQLMERKVRKLSNAGVRDDLQELLDVSKAEVSRLHHIITQFLSAVRPSEPKLEKESINEVLEESASFLLEELRDRGISVIRELREDLPHILADRDQLKQAFYNLIRNSSQAMKDGGELIIRSDMDDEHVKVSFQDSGGGISAEVMSKIFNPFFTTKPAGTGLGLLIVRRIVREQGGEIAIESIEKEGTKVTILLPLINRRVRLLETHPTEELSTKT